ncbi:MAG: toll/interleukin-1 receptor domain-containing protein [Rhodopseudomonas palustris]|uniref:Toll/interleukin-1 receptor domain-containing protein n=1 Tax=Rhodopseudomonas palustris TaxID=1076 RepID=A0A933RU57_RHOPL|nr:toll/interleukin-1 receptor domain-containing protein [Rhodopseudomonas palustris]
MLQKSPTPRIFISYSHKDEGDAVSDTAAPRWLTYIKSHLGPAQAHQHIKVWDDRSIEGGGDWRREIDDSLRDCDICILLVSRHSLTSRFILDVEMKTILERHQEKGVRLFPIVLSACDFGAAEWLLRFNLRPRDGKALELYNEPQRNAVMADLAREIRTFGHSQPNAGTPVEGIRSPILDIARLPETAYKRLVGRETEIQTLNSAWDQRGVNILSLISWGGAGKTTLVNDWLARIQRDNYRGAEAVLGWSFYDQGTKERASSADLFFEWSLNALGLRDFPADADQRGELLSCELKGRRVLLILDGVEPLQFGPGPEEGFLKDVGLKRFLKRFAAEPQQSTLGLVVLTSRLKIKDLGRFAIVAGSSPVVELERLSNEAGGELLADNDVIGSKTELEDASQEFGGHALALSLLAGYLVRRHAGDVRRRDCIGPLLTESAQTTDEAVHGHAKRVMRSIEAEWLRNQPLLQATMDIIAIFDRPAKAELVEELKKEFSIPQAGSLRNLSSNEWLDAISALREVRLIAPIDRFSPSDLDTHPLIRDWFASRLQARDKNTWKRAHTTLFRYLKLNTFEGEQPTASSLQPLYQAIGHACKAGLLDEAFYQIYQGRISRSTGYSCEVLGLASTDLATLSLFFVTPFIKTRNIERAAKLQLLVMTASLLGNLGRNTDAERTLRSALSEIIGTAKKLPQTAADVAAIASNLVRILISIGKVTEARLMATTANTAAIQAAGNSTAVQLAHTSTLILRFLEDNTSEVQRLMDLLDHRFPIDLAAVRSGYLQTKCEILLHQRRWQEAESTCRDIERLSDRLPALSHGCSTTIAARALLGRAIENEDPDHHLLASDKMIALEEMFNNSIARARSSGIADYLTIAYLSRARFRTYLGDWERAARDLAEATAIAEVGPQLLRLVEIQLQWARIALGDYFSYHPLSATSVSHTGDRRKLDEANKLLSDASAKVDRSDFRMMQKEISDLLQIAGEKRPAQNMPIRV